MFNDNVLHTLWCSNQYCRVPCRPEQEKLEAHCRTSCYGSLSRTFDQASQSWQTRRLPEQPGGKLTGHVETLKLTWWRNMEEFTPWVREMGKREIGFLLWPQEGKGHGLPVWTTKILCRQTWDFSSSVELSAAVLKWTLEGGLETLPFSKTGKRRFGGHKESRHVITDHRLQ